MSASDVKRLFLQAIISRQCMPLALAKLLCKNAVAAVKGVNEGLRLDYSENYFQSILGDVNRSLEPLSMEFRIMKGQQDGQDLCAIINLKGDEVAQLATQYTATEIAFFKIVVEQIMMAPNETFCVPSLSALHELKNLPSKAITQAQGEAILATFVANGWLTFSKAGRYSLSDRAVMELQPYLKSTYEEELLECTTCLEIVTTGISCYTPNCKCRLHRHCYKLHTRNPNNAHVCPVCQADWSASATAKLKKVGEEAAGRDDSLYQKSGRRGQGTQTSASAKGKGKARAGTEEEEEDEMEVGPEDEEGEDDIELDDDDEEPRARKTRPSQSKGKRPQSFVDDEAMGGEDDEDENEDDEEVAASLQPKPRRSSQRSAAATASSRTNSSRTASSTTAARKGKGRRVQSDSDEDMDE